jgi:hypothetical protein
MWWVVFCGSVFASAVSAQSAADLLQQGLDARTAGRDDEAARLFEAAHAVDGSPRALAQWALAEQALGRWVSAEARLVAALATEDPWIQAHRAVLGTALETIRDHLATLELTCDVDGVEVFADGVLAGTTPLDEPIRVRTGTTVVELRAPGYFAVRRPLEFEPRSIRREHVVLVAMSEGPPAEESARETEESAPEPRPVNTIERQTIVMHDDPVLQQALAWIGIGIGGASVAGAIPAWIIREVALDTWNDDAICNREAGPSRDDECPAEGDRWRVAETWSVIGFAAGAASIAAGVVLLLFLPSNDADVALECVPFAPGATCSVRF